MDRCSRADVHPAFGSDFEILARRATSAMDSARGLGGCMRSPDASSVVIPLEYSPQAPIHAVSVALAALPKRDLHPFRHNWPSPTVAKGYRLRVVLADHHCSVAQRAGAMLGYRRRSPRDARQYGHRWGLRGN